MKMTVFKSITFLMFFVLIYQNQVKAQQDFEGRTVNVNLPVGCIEGSGGAQNGAASYSIPIIIPSGTNGV